MTKDKNDVQNIEQQKKEKEHIKPKDIPGKIDIPDTRERRDGPGGN